VRTIAIVGAGIGGLTLALALARRGFASTVLEQAERLEETGAGIQLSPNATRILLGLGLGDVLRASAVAPEAVRVVSAGGREIVRVPLGSVAEQRYGAPYWALHRSDLQTALLTAVQATPEITLRLGTAVENYAVDRNGVALRCRMGSEIITVRGRALVGADGLWSVIRAQTESNAPPRFARRSAWRALVPAAFVPPEYRGPLVHLWLGRNAHLVHYPVKAGAMINIVAIVGDHWEGQSWSQTGLRDDLLARFGRAEWDVSARALLEAPDHWLRWALYDRAPIRSAGIGPVTLLGDAAHPVLPFLAQGAALAIEDAWVLAEALASMPDDPTTAMRAYEACRYARARRVWGAARGNGLIYHLSDLPAFARNRVMQVLGGEGMLKRYDWLYGWRPERFDS
jgi:salicylate hydroxylase